MSTANQIIKISCCVLAWFSLIFEANGQTKLERFNEITKDSFKSQFDKIEKELHDLWREAPEIQGTPPSTPKANPINVCKLNPDLPQCRELNLFSNR